MAERDGGANVRKLMLDEMWQYGNVEKSVVQLLIREAIANSLDEQGSGATRVDINLLGDKYNPIIQIMDNGKGMENMEVFKNYHMLGSESKKRTVGDIGSMGVGMKPITFFADIYTHTKCEDNEFASKWTFLKEAKDTKWDPDLVYDVPKNYELKNRSGTCISARFKDLHSIEEDVQDWYRREEINEEYITKAIQKFFNAVLLDDRFYKDKKREIYLKGNKVEAYRPKTKNERFRVLDIDGEKYPMLMSITEEELPEEQQGYLITVGKQFITQDTDGIFKAKPEFRKKIRAVIVADGFISIVKKSKDGFLVNKRANPLSSFYRNADKEWESFLKQEGAVLEEEPMIDPTGMSKSFQAKINKLCKIKGFREVIKKLSGTKIKPGPGSTEPHPSIPSPTKPLKGEGEIEVILVDEEETAKRLKEAHILPEDAPLAFFKGENPKKPKYFDEGAIIKIYEDEGVKSKVHLEPDAEIKSETKSHSITIKNIPLNIHLEVMAYHTNGNDNYLTDLGRPQDKLILTKEKKKVIVVIPISIKEKTGIETREANDPSLSHVDSWLEDKEGNKSVNAKGETVIPEGWKIQKVALNNASAKYKISKKFGKKEEEAHRFFAWMYAILSKEDIDVRKKIMDEIKEEW
jgi:hypothetical protein